MRGHGRHVVLAVDERDDQQARALLIDEVHFRARVEPWPFGNGHPRFWGWVNSPPAVMGVFAEALAVQDGRIVRVGQDADVDRLIGPGTAVIDLEGRTVVPGLTDSHLHLVRAGLTWTEETSWYEIPSLEEALAVLDAEAALLGRTALVVNERGHAGRGAQDLLGLVQPVAMPDLDAASPVHRPRVLLRLVRDDEDLADALRLERPGELERRLSAELDDDALGHVGLQDRNQRLHGAGDIEHVGLRLPQDRDADRVAALEVGELAVVARAELDAADRGLGCLGVATASYAEQERRTREYHRRIQLCDPVSSVVNDQVTTLNFLYCHEDRATAREVVIGDAGISDAYEGACPAHLVLSCGVFGNVSPQDIRSTIASWRWRTTSG